MFGSRVRRRLLDAEVRIRELEERIEHWRRLFEQRQGRLDESIQERLATYGALSTVRQSEEAVVGRALLVEVAKTVSDFFPDRKLSRDLTKSWRRGALAHLETWSYQNNERERIQTLLERYLFHVDRDRRE